MSEVARTSKMVSLHYKEDKNFKKEEKNQGLGWQLPKILEQILEIMEEIFLRISSSFLKGSLI